MIVTFEGTSESGAQFMTRQSYLPSEMHWGYVFTEIIYHAKEGETEHTVDISRYSLKSCDVRTCFCSGNASPVVLPVAATEVHLFCMHLLLLTAATGSQRGEDV